MAETATALASKPLTDAERKKLDEFLARAAAEADVHAPAVRIGRAYVALVNLSLPRRDNTKEDRQCDLVMAGDTVYLTDVEAAKYLRHQQTDGRRIAVIRLKSEVSSDGPPVPPPSLLSGPIFRPMTQMPDGTRPDPAGSTKVVKQTEVNQDSVPAGEASGGAPADLGALDIMPGETTSTDLGGAYAGADQDLLSAVKAQSGLGSSTRKG